MSGINSKTPSRLRYVVCRPQVHTLLRQFLPELDVRPVLGEVRQLGDAEAGLQVHDEPSMPQAPLGRLAVGGRRSWVRQVSHLARLHVRLGAWLAVRSLHASELVVVSRRLPVRTVIYQRKSSVGLVIRHS